MSKPWGEWRSQKRCFPQVIRQKFKWKTKGGERGLIIIQYFREIAFWGVIIWTVSSKKQKKSGAQHVYEARTGAPWERIIQLTASHSWHPIAQPAQDNLIDTVYARKWQSHTALGWERETTEIWLCGISKNQAFITLWNGSCGLKLNVLFH